MEPAVDADCKSVKSGVIVEEDLRRREGCPQGSPLSPMLSNIVLNELDQELERRGLRYSRWADDFVILLNRKEPQRVLKE